jgi:hypothetical protein
VGLKTSSSAKFGVVLGKEIGVAYNQNVLERNARGMLDDPKNTSNNPV